MLRYLKIFFNHTFLLDVEKNKVSDEIVFETFILKCMGSGYYNYNKVFY